MGHKQYFVYMMTNRWRNVLYTGLTNSLEKRVWQHKAKTVPGFTKKYNCDKLVYFEDYSEIDQAIAHKKQIKAWSRVKKEGLVAKINPAWKDLAADWFSNDTSKGIPRRLRGSE